jgi:hypothetical protein
MSIISRLGARFALSGKSRDAIQRRVVWFAEQRRLLNQAEVADRWALLAVIGREWYQERTKFYNIRNKSDLQKVLRLELAGNPRVQAFVGPIESDGYPVIFFELRPSFDIESIRAFCWIPESWLLARRLDVGEVISVDRDGFRYFQSGRGPSQLAGGIVNSAAVFALALGLPQGNHERVVAQDELQREIAAAVAGLSWRDAWLFRAPTLPAQTAAMARPVAAVATVTLLTYLSITTAWLEGMHRWRLQQLEKFGSEVTTLVDLQRDIGALARQQRRAAEAFSDRPYSIEIWQLVAEVWKRNAVLKSVTFENERIALIGMAPVATEVLQALSEHPLVKSAQFTAPVRESRGTQDFSIAVELKSGVARD